MFTECFVLKLDLRLVKSQFYLYKKGASFLFWMSWTSREQPIRKSHHQKGPKEIFCWRWKGKGKLKTRKIQIIRIDFGLSMVFFDEAKWYWKWHEIQSDWNSWFKAVIRKLDQKIFLKFSLFVIIKIVKW